MSLTCVLAEQRPFMLQPLRDDLVRLGVQISAEETVGDDLVALVKQMRPDVVILDAELPGHVRGWQALMALKAEASTANIPVLAYADLEYPWGVTVEERAWLEWACRSLADAYVHPRNLCFELPSALRQLGLALEPGAGRPAL